MKRMMFACAAMSALQVAAITATKEYVDRKDGEITNAVAGIAAQFANVYTKAETWSAIGDFSRTGGVAYAENAGSSDYAFSAGQADQASRAADLSDTARRTIVEEAKLQALAAGLSTNDVCNIVTNTVTSGGAWTVISPTLPLDHIKELVSVSESEYGWSVTVKETWDGGENIGEMYYQAEGDESRLTASTPDGTLILEKRGGVERNTLGLARMSDLPTNHVTHAELEAAINDIDIPQIDTSNLATKSELAAVSNESAIVTRLFMSSNVIDEVTNYNSAVRLPSRRMYQLTESNEYVRVWDEMDQHTNTLAKAEKHADDATNELARTLAPRAWSKTTSGLGADAPANTTWISTPTTVIAGGLEYSKVIHSYGQAWVLSGNGMIEFSQNTNAYFRIAAEDGTEIFSIEKTDAVTVGADADGITVSGNVVTIPVNVVSSDHPTMYWRQTLDSGSWSAETDSGLPFAAVWSGTSGAWVMTVTFSNTAPASSFFRFTYEVPGSTVIKNSAATDVSGGLVINGVHYSTIGTATISGHTVITVAP